LSTVFLDFTKRRYLYHNPYSVLFEKGVTIRIVTYDPERQTYVRLNSPVVRPAATGPDAHKSFEPFDNWEYSEKWPAIDRDSQHASNIQASIDNYGTCNRRNTLLLEAMHSRVDSWVASLPPPKVLSHTQLCKVSEPGCSGSSAGFSAETFQEPLNNTHTTVVTSSLPPSSKTDENTAQRDSKFFPGQLSTSSRSLLRTPREQVGDPQEDPFQALWKQARSAFGLTCHPDSTPHSQFAPACRPIAFVLEDDGQQATMREPDGELQTSTSDPHSCTSLPNAHQTVKLRGLEKRSRGWGCHSTSNTQSTALARSCQQTCSVEPHLLNPERAKGDLQDSISEKLVALLEPLRIFTGDVSLRAEIGRFCFTSIHADHVQPPDISLPAKQHDPVQLRNLLNKSHHNSAAVWFTPILTTRGGDADYITRVKNSSGERIWASTPTKRRVIYELSCRAQVSDGSLTDFIIDVDATTFEYNIRQVDNARRCVFVHCIQRSWDFQIVVSSTPTLTSSYDEYAKELVKSLRVS
jgi:hypothetical protein